MKNKKLHLLVLLALIVIAVAILNPTIAQASEEDVAKIGDVTYASLADAVQAVPTDNTETTITLLRNVENGTGFKTVSGQNIIINFNNFTYDISAPLVGSPGTETNGCQLLKGSTVVFKNGNLTSKTASFLIQNYSNLTLDNMTLDLRNSSASNTYVLSCNNGSINITGSTSIYGDNVAFDMYWWPSRYPQGPQITVDTTGTIKGNIELASENTASDIKATLNIKNIKHEGTIVAKSDILKDQVTISGGSFTSNVSEYLEEGFGIDENGDVFTDADSEKIELLKSKLGQFELALNSLDTKLEKALELVIASELDDIIAFTQNSRGFISWARLEINDSHVNSLQVVRYIDSVSEDLVRANEYSTKLDELINSITKDPEQDKTDVVEEENPEEKIEEKAEEKNTTNPSTGDSIIIFAVAFAIATLGLIVTIRKAIKNKK